MAVAAWLAQLMNHFGPYSQVDGYLRFHTRTIISEHSELRVSCISDDSQTGRGRPRSPQLGVRSRRSPPRLPGASRGINGTGMATSVTLKAVNDELARLGHRARLEKASELLL